MRCNRYCRYLKTLVKDFNSLTDAFLDKLKPLADGRSVVPMADHVRDFTVDVISKVKNYIQVALRIVWV